MSITLELALVAGAIAHPAEAQALLDQVPRGAILDPLLGSVWGAVADLVDAGQMPTLERVQAELLRAGLAERIGPSMADLARGGPLPQVQRAAALVRAAADQRRFVGILEGGLQDLTQLAPDQAQPAMAAILDGLLRSLGDRGAKRLDMADGIKATLERAEARARGELSARFWPLGVDGLDHLWAPAPRELVILGAASGGGKSAFSQWICTQFLLARLPSGALMRPDSGVVFVPLADLDGEALADRELAMIAPWPGKEVARDTPSAHALARMRAAVAAHEPALRGRYVIWEDTPTEVEDVAQYVRRERLRMLAQGVKLRLVVVDYAQTLRCRGHESMTQIQVLERVARVLKELAKSLEITVILPTQLNRNRNGDHRPPETSDIFGGSALEHFADVVLLMHPTAIKLRRDATALQRGAKRFVLFCRKFRAGAPFELPLIADLSTYRYWPEATCPTTIYDPPPPPAKKKGADDDDLL